MNETLDHADIFLHVRVVMGMVIGLGMARVLNGAAYFVLHPGKRSASFIHLGWAAVVLLTLIHFWWWELQLAALPAWNFDIYFFLTLYTIVLFLLCSLLFPDDIDEYDSYEQFFLARRRWFFGLLALSFGFGFADTILKGWQHLYELGLDYRIGLVIEALLCLIAMVTANRRFQSGFAAVALAYQASVIIRQLNN